MTRTQELWNEAADLHLLATLATERGDSLEAERLHDEAERLADLLESVGDLFDDPAASGLYLDQPAERLPEYSNASGTQAAILPQPETTSNGWYDLLADHDGLPDLLPTITPDGALVLRNRKN